MTSLSHPRKRYTRTQSSTDDNQVLGSDNGAAASSSIAHTDEPSRLNDEYTADYINQLANIDDDEEEDDDDEDEVRCYNMLR